jgi:hypothetical protein
VDLLVKRESGSAGFGTKVVPCLWRADLSFMNSVIGSGYVDLSFMNSVTGSGYVAKCSNILQDTYSATIRPTHQGLDSAETFPDIDPKLS